jgi:hypothetical protein
LRTIRIEQLRRAGYALTVAMELIPDLDTPVGREVIEFGGCAIERLQHQDLSDVLLSFARRRPKDELRAAAVPAFENPSF